MLGGDGEGACVGEGRELCFGLVLVVRDYCRGFALRGDFGLFVVRFGGGESDAEELFQGGVDSALPGAADSDGAGGAGRGADDLGVAKDDDGSVAGVAARKLRPNCGSGGGFGGEFDPGGVFDDEGD